MRDMVYNLPVLTPPRWVRSRTTPVALENTGTPDSRRRSPVT
jgi:hypothetical protein